MVRAAGWPCGRNAGPDRNPGVRNRRLRNDRPSEWDLGRHQHLTRDHVRRGLRPLVGVSQCRQRRLRGRPLVMPVSVPDRDFDLDAATPEVPDIKSDRERLAGIDELRHFVVEPPEVHALISLMAMISSSHACRSYSAWRGALCRSYSARRGALCRSYSARRGALCRSYSAQMGATRRSYSAQRDASCRSYSARTLAVN